VADASDASVDDPTGLVEAYEELREVVLAEQSGGWRLGHGVLTGRGVAAWMAARATVSATSVTAAPARHPSIPLPHRLPTTVALSLQHVPEIVAVLAQMALAHA
jgi:hypothetical protein